MLRDILTRCALEPGVSLANADQKAFVITKINEAAADVYTTGDLAGSLREQVFNINISGNQVSLPWQVGDIRSARYYHSGTRITLHDMRMRYHTDGWAEGLYDLLWRVKNVSATSRNLDSATRLSVSIPDAESQDFQVAITGSTTNSNRVEEKLTFIAGETSKETTSVFSPVKDFPIDFIGKSAPTTYDVTVEDANDNVLAVIPNNLTSSRYTIIQVNPRHLSQEQTSTCKCIEVLFKHQFAPFVNDYDQFITGSDRFDDAIYWGFVRNWNASQPGQEARVLLASQQITISIGQAMKENTMGKEKKIDFGPNQMRRMMYAGTEVFTGYGRRRLI